MRALRIEGYKLLHNRWTYIMVFALIAFGLFISRVGLYTYAQLYQKYGDRPLKSVMQALGVEGNSYDEVFALVMKDQYPRIFWHINNGLAYISFVFAAYFICRDFPRRSYNILINSGCSRESIFASKFISYYLASFFIGNVLLLLLLFMYASNWWTLPSDYLFRSIGLFNILLIGGMSIPFLLAFICKGPIIAGGVTIIASLILGKVDPLSRFYPIAIMGDRELWEQGAALSSMYSAMIISAVVFAVSTVASYLFFKFAELK